MLKVDRDVRARKPQADLELCFPGEGVYPERVPVRYLADVIAAIHRIAVPDSDEEEGAAVLIRLIDVRRGSAVFRCVAQESETLLSRLRIVAENLDNPEGADALGPALGPLRRLSEIAASLKSPVIVRRPGAVNGVVARFEPDTYDSVSRNLLVSGEKAVSGNVQRVGGATA
jgi:hypothetical protein